MKRVCFLDFDGVLNPSFHINALYKVWKTNNECKSRDQYGDYFSQYCVEYLQHIINKTGAQIVVSSTWRKSGLKAMIEMWEYRRLPGSILDITPVMNTIRGEEISEWLRENDVDSYVIIDDDDDFLPEQMQNFVQCDSRIGLTMSLAEKCIEILNKKP